ncbi:HAD family hydrolase [Cellulomonas sp. NPDC055163]
MTATIPRLPDDATTAPGGAEPTGVAFFDVDGTLLRLTSLVSFYEYYVRDFAPVERSRSLDALADLLRADLPREEANAAYYRLIAGEPVAEMAAAGRRWFAQVLLQGFVDAAVHAQLDAHRAAGRAIVLVSGSFPACLEPVAAHLGADRVLCSRPEIAHGRYTGWIGTPMIGDAKAAAVAAVLDELAPGTPSWAYGDHESDLPMLEQVRTPVVVGADAVLTRLARERGWEVLTGDGPLATTAETRPAASRAR